MFQRAFFEFRMFYPDGYTSHKACNKQIARTRREYSERVVLQGSLRLGEEMSMALKHLGKKVAKKQNLVAFWSVSARSRVRSAAKTGYLILVNAPHLLVRHYIGGSVTDRSGATETKAYPLRGSNPRPMD